MLTNQLSTILVTITVTFLRYLDARAPWQAEAEVNQATPVRAEAAWHSSSLPTSGPYRAPGRRRARQSFTHGARKYCWKARRARHGMRVVA